MHEAHRPKCVDISGNCGKKYFYGIFCRIFFNLEKRIA
jgi:hypothetical protein